MTSGEMFVIKSGVAAASHAFVVALLEHLVAVERRWWNVGGRAFPGHRLAVILPRNLVPSEEPNV